MANCVVIHYDEIALKGANRPHFENKLCQNIRTSLGGDSKRVYKRQGRLICELATTNHPAVEYKLSRLPGIANFLFAQSSELDIESLKSHAVALIRNRKYTSFRVTTSRADKTYPVKSPEVNRIVGELVLNTFGKDVELKNPDLTIYIEICEKEAFVGVEKNRGLGGLPVGVSGKLLASLSGGIDSPAAAYLMMKRGCRIIFVHIYNRTQVSSGVLDKLVDIVGQLSRFQLGAKLYVVPFEKLQHEIIINVPSQFRMIVYRRFMMKIINRIARREKAGGMVTGDSIGQVASQTLDNLACIREAAEIPVLSPLIGMNKQEIIQLAKKIDTYRYSIVPYPDCCSFMIAKHPETRGKLEEIQAYETNITAADELIRDAIKRSEIKSFT